MTSVVPRSMPRIAALARSSGRPSWRASRRRSSSATTASAVATSVTSVRTTPARSAPRIGRTLPLPGPDADRDRHAPSRRASNAITRSRRSGQTNCAVDVERRDEDLADGLRALQLAADVLADRRGAPGRAADPEERDVEPIPEVEDRAGRRRAPRAPLGGGVVDEPGRHQAVGLAARVRRRCGGTARAPDRSTSSRRPAARRSRSTGRGGVLERVGDGADRRPVPDPDDRSRRGRSLAAPRRRAGRPSGGSGPRDRRGSARDGPRRGRTGAAARRRPATRRRPVHDPDLDDALGPGALQEAATCGRVTPSRSAIAFCVSPSS